MRFIHKAENFLPLEKASLGNSETTVMLNLVYGQRLYPTILSYIEFRYLINFFFQYRAYVLLNYVGKSTHINPC